MDGPIANVEAARAWDDEGVHWAAHSEQYNASMRPHTDRLLEAAAIGTAERVVDIGCGSGETTRAAARIATGGDALGLDISRPLVARARELTATDGPANARFEYGDAQVFPFSKGAFDVAISRFGGMFFADPVAAYANIARSLRRHGRLVLVAWRSLDENEWLTAVRAALAAGRILPTPPADGPSPFSLADPARVAHLLGAAGFDDIELHALDLPFVVEHTVEAALEFFAGVPVVQGLLRDLDPATADAARAALRATLEAHDTGHGIEFGSSAWLIRAAASS